jgi:hypothetical protein
MTPVSREILQKIRKLANLPEEIRQCQFAVSITRLTGLKSLCHESDVRNRFVIYLAHKTIENVKRKHGTSSHTKTATLASHQTMMEEALEGMEAWQRKPTEKLRQTLTGMLARMRTEQNDYKKMAWGAVRIITDQRLILAECALSCILAPDNETEWWAYQTARQYTEQYDPKQGTGLISSSIPQVQDIVDFWMKEYDLTPESLAQSPKATRSQTGELSPKTSGKKQKSREETQFTHRQGQFLAFIHQYWKLHRQGPAELDLVRFFRVTPPSVHSMVVKLQELGLITKKLGVARSIRIAIPTEQLPELEASDGPPV